MENVFGLLGRNIGYSFSKDYFTRKFVSLSLNSRYENFDIKTISELPHVLESNPDLSGLNVTIPYKETIFPFLDSISDEAQRIGAVNVIRIRNRKLEGHNTDWYGFRESLRPLISEHHKYALILGTGGAAKAVAFALNDLGLKYRFVSRTDDELMHYNELNQKIMQTFTVIINCTPVGTFPDIENAPPIPYEFFTRKHIAYDLIYNPEKTSFLKQAESYHAILKNGREMLELQAERAWEIWNS
jgi:shikimate dehydrogenase